MWRLPIIGEVDIISIRDWLWQARKFHSFYTTS
jgi:hypothetical protein